MRARLLALFSSLCLLAGLAAHAPAAAAASSVTISGTVYGDDGAPLPDVRIVVTEDDKYGTVAELVSGSDGTYGLTVPTGVYQLEFSHGDPWISTSAYPFTINGRDAAGVNVQLLRRGSVRGRIAYEDGDGSGKHYADLLPMELGVRVSAPVLPDGTFEFVGVQPGRYGLRYPSTAHGDRTYGVQDDGRVRYVDVGSGQAVTLPVERSHGDPETGTIVADLTGTEKEYPTVTALKTDGFQTREAGLSRGLHEVATLDLLTPGQYRLSLSRGTTWFGGFSLASATPVTVVAGQTTRVRAQPGPGTYIYGRVVNQIGEPLDGMNIELLRDESPGEVITDVRTNFLGRFEVDAVDRTRYSIRVSDSLGQYATRTFPAKTGGDLLFDPPTTYQLVRSTPFGAPFSGPASASASGTYSSGRPSSVVCFFPTNDRTRDGVICAKTQQGRYVAPAIPPGTYKVRVGGWYVDADGAWRDARGIEWLGGRSYSSAAPITFGPGEHKDLDVPGIGDEGYVTGRIFGSIGVAMPDLTVLAYAADDAGEVIRTELSDSTSLGPSGSMASWTMRELPRRPYKFKLVDGTGRYESTWLGGSSFSSATTITPLIDGQSVLPDVRMTPRLGALAPPVVSGTPQVGATITTTQGFWSLPGLSFSYQWLRDGSAIAGATGATYRPAVPDVGARLTVRVSGHDASGVASTTSLATAAVAPAPTVARAKATPSARLKIKRLGGRKVRLTMAYTAPGVVPTGRVTVRRGSKTVVSWRHLRNGRLSVTLRNQPKGRVRYTVRYSGSTTVHEDVRRTPTVRIR